MEGAGCICTRSAAEENNWRCWSARSRIAFSSSSMIRKHGKLHGKLVAVLAKSPDLEPIAREAGLKIRLWEKAATKPGCAFLMAAQIAFRKSGGSGVLLQLHADFCRRELWRRIGTRSSTFNPPLLHVFLPGGGAFTSRRMKSGVRVQGCTAHFVPLSSSMRGR